MTQTVDAVETEVRPLLLAGRPVTSVETAPVIFPYDGTEAARVSLADEAVVEQALASAGAAERDVAAIPPYRRAEILIAAADIVRSREADLARQMTLETGNAVWETRFEAQRTAEILQIAGEEARRSASTGELVPIDAVPRGEGRIGLTRRFPVGTVLAITPFNAPLLLVAHKLGPALAAGCPCIVRPASKTPLSALSMGEILLEAGAPPEAVTVVPCRTELAERMVRDERVKLRLLHRERRGRLAAAEGRCDRPRDPRAGRQRRGDRRAGRQPRLRGGALRLRRVSCGQARPASPSSACTRTPRSPRRCRRSCWKGSASCARATRWTSRPSSAG